MNLFDLGCFLRQIIPDDASFIRRLASVRPENWTRLKINIWARTLVLPLPDNKVDFRQIDNDFFDIEPFEFQSESGKNTNCLGFLTPYEREYSSFPVF